MRRHLIPRVLLLALFTLAFPSCYERSLRGIINPDGSGRVLVETDYLITITDPQKAKPDSVLSAGRQIAADFINSTHGVDAWSDVAVTEPSPGHIHIVAVAYFPNISKLRFDLPLVFGWEKRNDGSYAFTITRERNPQTLPPKLSDAEIQTQVKQAQTRYKDQQADLKTALNAFKQTIAFTMPGEVTTFHQLTRDDQTLSIIFDGKKIGPALDKFMADDAAIAAAIKSGDSLMSNDDMLLESMYGHKGAIEATVKVAADAVPFFNYRLESKTAQLNQPDMLKAANIELLAKFVVKDSTPSTKPK